MIYIKFKGPPLELSREQALLRKSKTLRKSPEKWTFLSLAFYNAPGLRTVEIIFVQIEAAFLGDRPPEVTQNQVSLKCCDLAGLLQNGKRAQNQNGRRNGRRNRRRPFFVGGSVMAEKWPPAISLAILVLGPFPILSRPPSRNSSASVASFPAVALHAWAVCVLQPQCPHSCLDIFGHRRQVLTRNPLRPHARNRIRGGRKKPININNFAGLSREWVGVKLFMCFPFFFGKNRNT